MLVIKKLLLPIFILALGGTMVAQVQGPTVSVTFQADASVTEPIEITFARQTLSLPAFVAPAGSSVVFRSGLKANTDYFLDGLARKSNLTSRPYTFKISPTKLTVTVIVSIKPNLPTSQQILFVPDSGVLLPRQAGL